MNSAKSRSAATNKREAVQDGFMTTLRQALEHVGDADWLKTHSPLESVLAAGGDRPNPSAAALPNIGIKKLDDRLHLIWQEWEARPKTHMQTLLWLAVRQVPADKDFSHAALLLLTYFDDPRPKQGQLIGELALGKSTFYRHLDAAVQKLEKALIAQLRVSLQLEMPTARPLIGRDDLLQACFAQLQQGGVVSVVGASGLGKTALGAQLAELWRGPQHNQQVFWHTIRLQLTDNVQHVIHALALFFHQQGLSDLWLYLAANPRQVSPAQALAIIRKSLEELSQAPPLLCFDEVDLLLPNELDENENHIGLRAFLEDLAESPRHGSPLLLMGQRLLMEPHRDRLFTLNRFGPDDVKALFQQTQLDLNDAALDAVCDAAMKHTRGNPLLLHLFITLLRVGDSASTSLAQLSAPSSLDWFVARLRRHLAPKEQDVLDEICIFDAPAPEDLWRKQGKVLDRLIDLQLVERQSKEAVAVPAIAMLPALRAAFYRQLPAEVRDALHVLTAQSLVERGMFTHAAHHFVLGHQPEHAIWVWYAHREEEIKQGQALTALRIFEPLRFVSMMHERDRRVLVLTLSNLYYLSGKQESGLEALDSISWPAHQPSSARAHELRGRFLAMRGDMDRALAEYRANLETISAIKPTKPVTLRAELARRLLFHLSDTSAARREALIAQTEVEILLGDIEDYDGQLELAHQHFAHALHAATELDDAFCLATVYEAMGCLEIKRRNLSAALPCLEQASKYHRAYGNQVAGVGLPKILTGYGYNLARRYDEAVKPLQEALAFFQDLDQPYFSSSAEGYLAEAYAHLDRLQEAEDLAWRALAREEPRWRGQSLSVLAHIRRQQQRFEEAEPFCTEAIRLAETTQDLETLAPAWQVLAEVYADWGKHAEARDATEKAIGLYAQMGVQVEVERLQRFA